MSSEYPTIQTNTTPKLSVRSGARVILSTSWGDEAFMDEISAELVGYVHYEFVALRINPTPGVLQRLMVGNVFQAKYIHDGSAHSFRTELLSHITRPAMILFLSYPATINSKGVRKFKRLKCTIPASIIYGNLTCDAIVSDLSLGGCNLLIDTSGKGQLRALAIGEKLNISTLFRSPKACTDLEVEVKNVEIEQFKLTMGVSFIKLNNEHTNDLAYLLRECGQLIDSTD